MANGSKTLISFSYQAMMLQTNGLKFKKLLITNIDNIHLLHFL